MKSIRKRPPKRPTQNVLENEEIKVLESESDSLESNCIIVAARR